MKVRRYPQNSIIIVDDEESFLRLVKDTLMAAGLTNLELMADGTQLLPMLHEQQADLVLLDMIMPSVSGEALLEELSAQFPHIPVIMLTAVNDLQRAVNCMKLGAFDYLVKPVDAERLAAVVQRAVQLRETQRESDALRAGLQGDALTCPEAFSHIITADPKMQAIFRYLEAVAPSPRAVLVTGETGVGKEGIAKALHTLSGRQGELVKVNVAGIDDTMFADTLFGHSKGAFTGADQARAGLIQLAEDGTLFLDEIGDLGPNSQIKLLQLLQDGTYLPLGADLPKMSNTRVVAATNRQVPELKASASFRRDLFYRLCAHQVHLPALRDRKQDITLLVAHFVAMVAGQLNKTPPIVPRELPVLLENYDFPGNILELEAMVADAVSLSSGTVLSLKSFAEKVQTETPTTLLPSEGLSFPEPLPTLKQVEWALIEEALERAQGNQGIAAGLLGMTRQALNNRLRRRERLPGVSP